MKGILKLTCPKCGGSDFTITRNPTSCMYDGRYDITCSACNTTVADFPAYYLESNESGDTKEGTSDADAAERP